MRRDQLDVERSLPLGGCAPDDGRGRARAPMLSHLPKSAGEQSNPRQALHSRRQLELPRTLVQITAGGDDITAWVIDPNLTHRSKLAARWQAYRVP
jgi:hypothetical protein